MPGIYDDDPTGPGGGRTRDKQKQERKGSWMLRFGDGAGGAIVGLAVTLVGTYLLALLFLSTCGQFLSLGSLFGWPSPFVIAIVLTAALYLWDRSNR